MNSVLILLFLLIVTEYPYNCMLQFCPNQLLHNANNIDILWSADTPNNYHSSPICLNSNFEFINRTCLNNSQWSPPQAPICSKIQEKFEPKCGPNASLYEDICIYQTKPQSWTGSCPVLNVYNITEAKYVEILYKHNLSEVWLPIKRSEPFGKFEWKQTGRMNIKYTHPMLQKSKGSPNNNCILLSKINKNSFSYIPKITNCSAEYPTVCMYPILSQFAVTNSKRYCSTRVPFKCFYMAKQDPIEPNNSICKENYLAEPLSREENYLIKQMIGDHQCWFGLKRKEDDGIFQWPTAQKQINYSDWTISNVFQRNFLNVSISKNGWQLSHDGNLSCAVCQLGQQYANRNPTLTLQINKDQTALILTAYLYLQFLEIVCQVTGLDDIYFGWTFMSTDFGSEVSLILQDELRTVWLIKPLNPNYNYYQCTGEVLPKGEIIETKKILFGLEPPGHEYAFELWLPGFCKDFYCDPHFHFFDIISEKVNKKSQNKIRAVRVKNIDNVTEDLTILIHIRTRNTYIPIQIERNKLQHNLNAKFNQTGSLISFKSSDGCLSSVTGTGNMSLHWNFTEIGTVTASNELCLQSNLLPVTRMCAGDFLTGAHWLDVEGTCQINTKPSQVTQHLFDLYLNNSISIDVLKTLSNLTKKDLIPADIYYISQIFNKATLNDSNSTLITDDMSTTVSNIMATNTSYLEISNRVLYSTNTILHATERIMEYVKHIDYDKDGIFKTVKPNYMYYIFDPNISNFTGIALYRSNTTKPISFNDYVINSLRANASIVDLINEKLELATYIPEDLLEQLTKNVSEIKIHISVFHDDSLFIESNISKRLEVASKVVCISIQKHESYLPLPIPILFRPTNTSKDFKPQCSYWDSGSSTGNTKYPSHWATDDSFNMKSEEDIQICNATHLTNFALLVGYKSTNNVALNFQSALHQNYFTKKIILDIITATGCVLSTIGICGLIATALIFKTWRQKIAKKILLNVAVCSALQIFALYLADMNNIQRSSAICILTGATLHYSILSGFGWSLVTAVLQYFRFVRVISVRPSHLLLKTSLIGWILPSIPVIILLCVDSNIYIPETMEVPSLCYPQGHGLYAGLFVPVIIVLLVNLMIFVLIIYSVISMTKTAITSASKGKNMLAQQMKLAVLLFFLLGLTWLFGFLAAIKQITVFYYLFCATATLQGFILFLFYVVLDANTRKLWIKLFKTKMIPVANNNKERMSNVIAMNQATVDTNTNEDLYEDFYDEIKNLPVTQQKKHAAADDYEEVIGSHIYDKIKTETHREGGLPVSRRSQ